MQVGLFQYLVFADAHIQPSLELSRASRRYALASKDTDDFAVYCASSGGLVECGWLVSLMPPTLTLNNVNIYTVRPCPEPETEMET